MPALEEFERCMHLALTYLGYRARTEKEMTEYLTKKEMPPEAIAAVLERLRGYGYLNDRDYAQRFAQSRTRKGGARKIAYELRQKGIGDEEIDEAIASIDPDEALTSAKGFARKSLRGEGDQRARQRAYAALSRRGYSGDVVRAAIDAALAELGEEEDDGWE